MSEQIERIIDDITNALDKLEEDTFKNHREYYIVKKEIIEEHRDQLTRIKKALNEPANPQEIEKMQSELKRINDDIQKGCIPNRTESGQTFQELMNDLNEDKKEMVLPKESINPNMIDSALENLTIPNTQEDIVVSIPTIDEIPSLPEEVELPKVNENINQTISPSQPNENAVLAADVSNDIDLSVLDSILDDTESNSSGTDAFRI